MANDPLKHKASSKDTLHDAIVQVKEVLGSTFDDQTIKQALLSQYKNVANTLDVLLGIMLSNSIRLVLIECLASTTAHTMGKESVRHTPPGLEPAGEFIPFLIVW